MNTILDQVNNIDDEELALQLLDSLQSIDTSAEISSYVTCGGKMYYEWWIANQHGINATIVEAVQSMFLGKLQSILC
ncbi:hypothetical protein [Dictyobacter formicarum]|uniref:Uncharacterized protein n=1 Tax=Dictyobacter formicarum TaxID=2778368 RepID=A0ABQ3VC77_9CHLR|nr:hypothetical protein [Dictyobacter formicarum]GHO82801.1 hypothetical protein KSZ_08070 [Dictyobacter formicarum]